MNKAFLVGRLTRDPESRTTPNGISVCTIALAVNRRMNREMTDYFNVIAWRGLADNCAKYLVKGQRVAVVGEIQTRSYDDKNGVKRFVTEISADDIEFLDRPTGQAAGSAGAPRSASVAPPKANDEDLFASEMGGILMEDEELPF